MKLLFVGIASAVALNASAAVTLGAGTAAGAASSTVAIPITVVRGAADAAGFASATFTVSYTQANLSANPTFVAAAAPWPGATGINCTFAPGQATCGFATAGPFTNPVVPAASYTIGTMSFPLAAAPAFPVALTAALVECTDQNGTKLAVGSCVPQNGSITAGPPVTAPTATIAATSTLTAGAGTVAVTVTGAGTAGGSLGLACTIPATGASAFAVTAGANRTITGVATLGANAPAIGLSCVPQAAAAVNATLSCAQTPTPAAVLPALTSVITCPMGTPVVAPTATIAAATTLTGGAGTIAVNVVTAGNAGGSLALACTVPAGANAFTITAGANRTITGPATVGVNAPAIGVSCTPPAGASTTATVTCTQTATPGGVLASLTSVATCPGIPTPITANTAPGAVTLPGYVTPGAGTSSTPLSFSITGGAGQLACVASGTGYTATPNPLNMTVAGPNVVTVTYTGTVAGTFTGGLTCTPVAPATGGPFVYTLSTTVGVPFVNAVQVPALGNISLMLLIAGFLGLGAVLVGRRQA